MSWANWGSESRTPDKSAAQSRTVFGQEVNPITAWPGTPLATQVGQTTSGTPQAAPPAAPAAAFGSGSWWDTPGLQIRGNQAWNPDAGAYTNLTIPDWLRGDPGAFYGTYQSAPESYRPALVSSEQDRYRTEQQDLAQVELGRGYLTGQQADVNQAAQQWANDPSRQLVTDTLTRQLDPGYSFFSPAERTAATTPVAGAYANARTMSSADAWARGEGQGGGNLQNQAALRTLAETGGNQVRAQIDAAERQLKQQALSALGSTTAQYNAADTAYVNAGNQLAGALAALEAGVDFQPTDYTVWPALNEATQRADEEARQRDEAMRIFENESRYGLQDLGNTLISAAGSGIPQWLMGLAA